MITINARGARTLADATQLFHAGTGVYVTFSDGNAQLHLGGHIVAERPSAEILGMKDAQDWAYEMIETAEALVIEAVPGIPVDEYATAVHGPAAQKIRSEAATTLAEADRQDELAVKMAVRPTLADEKNPRHPKHKAAKIQAWADYLRVDAEILAAWTALDEMNYKAYLDEGFSMTDGHFAPEARAQWKRHQG